MAQKSDQKAQQFYGLRAEELQFLKETIYKANKDVIDSWMALLGAEQRQLTVTPQQKEEEQK